MPRSNRAVLRAMITFGNNYIRSTGSNSRSWLGTFIESLDMQLPSREARIPMAELI